MADEEKKASGPELVGDEDEKKPAEGGTGAGVSRRGAIVGAVAGVVVGAAAGAGIMYGAEERKISEADAAREAEEADMSPTGKNYNKIDLNMMSPSFYDQEHPMGIKDPFQQRYVTWCEFDMTSRATRDDLKTLLATWSAAASLLMEGKELGEVRPTFKTDSVPGDTGETYDLYPANLTITFAFGPTLFISKDGIDRYGIASFKPEALVEIPRCAGDRFSHSEAGSDLGVQICADDPQVIQHAVRALQRKAGSTATLKYTHSGFMPMRQSGEQTTPRDLFGFRDGTTNPVEDDEFEKDVWVYDAGDWMYGSSYLVYRNCRINMESWDRDRISDQEDIVGRVKDTGAPNSSPDGEEFDPVDLDAVDENGEKLINPNSHVAITSDQRLGYKVFRRDYNFWEGLDDDGLQKAGFVHLTYENDPLRFWKLRNDMGKYDLLNEYYYDLASATYAVPKSPATGRYVGMEFFEVDPDEDMGQAVEGYDPDAAQKRIEMLFGEDADEESSDGAEVSA